MDWYIPTSYRPTHQMISLAISDCIRTNDHQSLYKSSNVVFILWNRYIETWLDCCSSYISMTCKPIIDTNVHPSIRSSIVDLSLCANKKVEALYINLLYKVSSHQRSVRNGSILLNRHFKKINKILIIEVYIYRNNIWYISLASIIDFPKNKSYTIMIYDVYNPYLCDPFK